MTGKIARDIDSALDPAYRRWQYGALVLILIFIVSVVVAIAWPHRREIAEWAVAFITAVGFIVSVPYAIGRVLEEVSRRR